jgi:uncharacterized protein involved in exopolysaccharide biosynthesis
VYSDRLLALAEKQTEAGIGLQNTDAQLKSARSIWKAGAPKGVSPEAVFDSQSISDLREKLSELEVSRATLLEDLTENHPKVVDISQQIKSTKREIKAEIDSIAKRKTAGETPALQELLKQLVLLQVEQEGLASNMRGVTTALKKSELAMSNLPPAELTYARLLRDARTAETVYVTLLKGEANAQIAEGKDPDSFVVVDSAVAEKKPERPRMKLVMVAALMIGLMIGSMVAVTQGFPKHKKASV